jgi:hypothetical protein
MYPRKLVSLKHVLLRLMILAFADIPLQLSQRVGDVLLGDLHVFIDCCLAPDAW